MLIDVLIDACFYLFITTVNIGLAIVGTMLGWALRRSHPELSKTIIKGSWFFAVAILITGFVLTECWGHWVFGRFYWHFDYLPGIDCSPFWFNPQYGTEYYGITKEEILGIWSVYALLCWSSAAVITFALVKFTDKNPSNHAIQRTVTQSARDAER